MAIGLTLASACFPTASARADVLVFEFTAELDLGSVNDTIPPGLIIEGLLDSGVSTLTGTFFYDTDATGPAGPPFFRSYSTGELTFDQFSDTPTGLFSMGVFNNAGSGGIDRISNNQSYADELVEFDLEDADGTAFNSTALPTALDLSDFETAQIRFVIFEGQGEFGSFVTLAEYNLTELELVPEPNSLALLGLGGLILTRRQKRK